MSVFECRIFIMISKYDKYVVQMLVIIYLNYRKREILENDVSSFLWVRNIWQYNEIGAQGLRENSKESLRLLYRESDTILNYKLNLSLITSNMNS